MIPMSAAFEAFRTAVAEASRDNPARLVALVLGSGMGPVTDRITPRSPRCRSRDVPGLVAADRRRAQGADHSRRARRPAGTGVHRPAALLRRPPMGQGRSPDRGRGRARRQGAGADERLRRHQRGIAPGSLMALTDHIEWNRPKLLDASRPRRTRRRTPIAVFAAAVGRACAMRRRRAACRCTAASTCG